MVVILMELMMGLSGVVVYLLGYFVGVCDLCDWYGILLIFDEIMMGFGCMGVLFCVEWVGVLLDLILFVKGVSFLYMFFGGVLVCEGVVCYFDMEFFDVGYMYVGYVLVVVGGFVVLKVYLEEGLFEWVCEIEGWLCDGFGELVECYLLIGDVWGMGV